jgi:hypothetical protein
MIKIRLELPPRAEKLSVKAQVKAKQLYGPSSATEEKLFFMQTFF